LIEIFFVSKGTAIAIAAAASRSIHGPAVEIGVAVTSPPTTFRNFIASILTTVSHLLQIRYMSFVRGLSARATRESRRWVYDRLISTEVGSFCIARGGVILFLPVSRLRLIMLH